jgi:hypothetical protein
MPQFSIPPGACDDVRDSSYDSWTHSRFFTCKYQTVDGLIEFYQEHLNRLGWEDEFTGLTRDRGPLVYKNGKEQVMVTIVPAGAGISVSLRYTEFEYTHDEFASLIRETRTSEAVDIVEEVSATYSDVGTYRDFGTDESVHDGKVLSTATFETKYLAPHNLFLNYARKFSNGFESGLLLVQDERSVRTMSRCRDEPTEEQSIETAIARLAGVTHGTSTDVPQLLLNLESKSLFYLANLQRIDDAEHEDCTPCIRIRGAEYMGCESTIWIDASTHLIRTVKTFKDDRNFSTRNYFPDVNVELSAEELVFPELKSH